MFDRSAYGTIQKRSKHLGEKETFDACRGHGKERGSVLLMSFPLGHDTHVYIKRRGNHKCQCKRMGFLYLHLICNNTRIGVYLLSNTNIWWIYIYIYYLLHR